MSFYKGGIMKKQNNKIAIINFGNFIDFYKNDIVKLCKKYKIQVDIIEKNEISNCKIDVYDYVISDNLPIEGCCKTIHQQSIMYRMNKNCNIFYKIIYYLGHIKRIRETYKLNRSYKRLICVSSEVKRDLEKYYKIPSENLIVAHAGFIPPAQSNDGKEFKKLEQNEVFTICTSAVGFVNKGGYTLLRALRYFKKEYPNIRLKANIIYPNHEKNLAVKLYVKLFGLSDVVEFFGYQNDINEFYNKAHCLTCQSLNEAFGRIVTEAMYQKIPVIVGSNVGAADIILDGVNGFIFEDNNNKAKNLAKKIKEVHAKYNKLESLVEKAYETSKNTTWENFAKDVFYGLYPEFKI